MSFEPNCPTDNAKKYKTLLPLPGIPAQAIGEKFNENGFYIFEKNNDTGGMIFHIDHILRYPDFFHDMDTPEPEKADPWNVPAKQEPAAEPTIGELLAILDHTDKVVVSTHPECDIYRAAGDMLAARLGITEPIFKNFFQTVKQ